MEEKENKTEDFKDFDEENVELPELEEDLVEEEIEEKIEEIEVNNQDETTSLNEETEEKKDELTASVEDFTTVEETTTPETQNQSSLWDELSENNAVVKKYIVYIAKDFVPYIDSLSLDDRMAYINDAIQKKIDLDDEEIKKAKKKKMQTHFILAILTFLITIPLGLLIVNKAIIATFNNYRYSEQNIEKLYKQRFENDKAFMRSLQYNKELQKRMKENSAKVDK